MLFGDTSLFAIELEIVRATNDWVFGRFLFWIRGAQVGDSTDPSVHLKACIGWLDDFIRRPRRRYEPGLFELEKESAFRFVTGDEDEGIDFNSLQEATETRFSRFDISYLGMSSFDRVTLLLFEDLDGRQRLLWQTGEGAIGDATLPVGQLQTVASSCVKWFAARYLTPGESDQPRP
jgi:hypothetical protein